MVLLKRHKDIAFINYVWDPAQYIYNKVYSNSFHYMINRIMRSLLKKVDQYFLERADDIILGGAAHKKYIEMFSSDFLICMPSVNIDEHACCLLDKAFYSEPYIFVMTAWKEGKNPEFLIDLTKKIPNLVIYMGGMWIDRVDKDRFKQILIEREACENIKILGTLSESELNYYYKNARAVLQTNDDRGFGMSALEGAANCTPFIIPEDQGVCDLFVNGEHGFFTKQYDINKICELIELFINDAEYSIMLGKKAFTNVKKYYTWDHHAKIISERITKCLS